MRGAFIVLMTIVAVPSHADLICGGTEPFWNLTIGVAKAVYENIGEGKKTIFDSVVMKDAQGIKSGNTRKYLFKNESSSADAVVLKKACSDDMSDTNYPYTITFSIGHTVLSGCCK